MKMELKHVFNDGEVFPMEFPWWPKTDKRMHQMCNFFKEELKGTGDFSFHELMQ